MQFPKKWEQFLHDYEFEDSRRIYTNGSKIIPSFRVKQMFEHYIIEAKSEAIKEFAERLCEDRVSNDPVVIAVKAELKEMTGQNDFKEE